jgi:hypothetical protein
MLPEGSVLGEALGAVGTVAGVLVAGALTLLVAALVALGTLGPVLVVEWEPAEVEDVTVGRGRAVVLFGVVLGLVPDGLPAVALEVAASWGFVATDAAIPASLVASDSSCEPHATTPNAAQQSTALSGRRRGSEALDAQTARSKGWDSN